MSYENKETIYPLEFIISIICIIIIVVGVAYALNWVLG